MVNVQDNENEASSSTSSHRMRITSGGQVSGYVNFALSFLKENPNRSLVLHTLPSPSQTDALPEPSSNALKTSISTLNPSLLATPKLISVTEKIKRDYMAYINTSESGKGKNKAVGIWQYTESGLLPSTNPEPGLGLEDVLEGRNKPKMVHRPFLQITLSTKPLGLEQGPKGRNVTCQYVMVRRRKSKLNSGNEGDAVASVPDPEPSSKTAAVEGSSGGQEKMGAAKERGPKGENAIKRKAASSQPEATRGGKKRKK